MTHMKIRYRAFWVVLAAVALALWATPSHASSAPVKAPTVTVETSAQVAALVGCPSGDGTVTWGNGKVCPDPAGARFHIQDALTDGFCVQAQYHSADAGAWVNIGPQACNTGQWITFTTNSTNKLCSPDARLWRVGAGGANTFTMPTTVC